MLLYLQIYLIYLYIKPPLKTIHWSGTCWMAQATHTWITLRLQSGSSLNKW